MLTSHSISRCSESVNAAPHIAALFADGALAYQTRDMFGADTLQPQETQYLARAVPKRIHEFAAGRACARAGLSQLGFGIVALPMGADRAPQWPAGATGSITHTEGFCAAVVATSTHIRALGLDAERADCVKPHLWRRICTPEELATLLASDAQAALAAATLIFSAKEAFYKCQYTLTRQWLGFADLSLDVRAGEFTVRATRPLQIADHSPGPWHGKYLREGNLVITGACIV
jgi:enterobactin synthetase component D / holo-[acyl-carrier protein] synthase